MKQLYETYKDYPIVSTLLRQISWSNNIKILSLTSSIKENEFYIKRSEKNMQSWKCPKCENEEYIKDQFQATGGDFAKVFNVQNKKFITIILFYIIDFIIFAMSVLGMLIVNNRRSYGLAALADVGRFVMLGIVFIISMALFAIFTIVLIIKMKSSKKGKIAMVTLTVLAIILICIVIQDNL